ncbi:MAG: filamentous hemagglutinin N-terminal domain-containing protein, partial [Lacisediminimonas sp.]|nr:filamentous hemagglutinin N-terminal domain-containing protein [Lacisediminimonas sp.]
MNKTFHSVWNASKQAYVAAAETVSARGKPCSGTKVAAAVASLLGGLLSLGAWAQTAPPTTALPTGGQVSAGQASISQSGANMVIQQGSNRAAINWQTFNVGSGAQVQFQQPGASSVTLNRVMSSDPSQIFGRITANGQVILTNPQGVYFGKDARVDVGGIIATTHGISDADFMAGKNRFERNGSTGSVVNEGELKASLGGYIALLAPEVRNQGAIIAQMGTVALAAGEAVDLHFDSNNRLTSIRVEPSQIQALVDNRHAVQAPGGLIVLSAQSMDRLVGGVVRNSGRIEANGLQQQGGRIMLSASHKLGNTGTISANATAEGPAGKVEISAPEVVNSGSINAVGNASYSAGSVLVQATNFTQTAIGRIDLSAPEQGGTLSIQTTGKVQLQGQVDVSVTQDQANSAPTQGGQIDIAAGGDIEVTNATLDASGGQGGKIQLRAAAPAQSDNPNPLPEVPHVPGQGRLAIMGNSTLSTRGRSGNGGLTTLLGDHIDLLDTTHIDGAGATGGGTVLVGGDWQGSNGVYQATAVTMGQNAVIDASATDRGDGGKVVLWSDVHKASSLTTADGSLYAKGGQNGGNGGQIETSGARLDMGGGLAVDAGSTAGQGGLWLIDPYNYSINVTAAGNISGALNLGTSVTVSTSTSNTSYGGSANSSDPGTISIDSAIAKTAGNAATLTLSANNAISGTAYISNTSVNLLSVVFDVGASATGTYSGTISGSTQVTKAGAGTLVLSGTSTYTGATNVNAGTLKVNDTGHLYCSTTDCSGAAFGNVSTAITTVNSGAILELTNWGYNGSLGSRYFDAYALVINGGTLRYSGATTAFTNSYGRGFTVGSSGATFESATAGANWSLFDYASSNVTYRSVFNGGVTFTGAGDFTVSHVITNPVTGSNTVTQNGSGTVTLLANNTYTGATNINAGTLVLQNDAPTKGTSGFAGPGVLRIESAGTTFTNAFSTSGWNFGPALSGLTIGKSTNTANIVMPGSVTVNGPISIYGGSLFMNGDISSTASTGGNVLLLGSGDVLVMGNVQTAGSFSATAGAAKSFVMGLNYATGAGSTISANGGVTI